MKRKLSVPLLLLLVTSLFLVFHFSVQPTKAVFGPEDIFFEYGAESGGLQPPWDSVSGGGIIEVDDTYARTGTESIYMYQHGKPKDDQDRRNHLREYGSSHDKSEGYISWWMYISSQLLETDDASRVTLGGWQLWFGPSGSTWMWWEGGRFRIMEDKRVQYSYKWGNAYGWGFDSDAGTQRNEGATAYDLDDYENQWVHFQIYWKIAESNGACKFWFNDNLVADITGLHSDPRYYSSSWNNNPESIARGYSGQTYMRWSCGDGYPNIGIEIYQDQDSFENWVWFDDIVGSDEKVTEAYGVGEVSSEFESWENGFEEGDFSAWNNTHYAGGGEAPSITSSQVYTGTYATNFTTDGADDSYADAMHIIQDASEIFQRSYVRFEDLPDTNNTRLMVMRMERESTYIVAVGVLNLSGNMYWCIDITGGSVNPPENYTLATIVADTWYLMEFYFNSTTNGNATLWINNVLQCEETGDYSSHGDLQQVYPYLYVEGLQTSAKMVYHDNYRVDDVRIGGGTPEIIIVIDEPTNGDGDDDDTVIDTDPLQNVVINGTYLTDSSGYYEFTNLTYNQIYLFIAELPSGYYPKWVENVDGSFSWNGTHFLIYHNVTETHEGYIKFVFTQTEDAYIQYASNTIDAVFLDSTTLSFNVTADSGVTSTTEIYVGERGLPNSINGATTWSYDDPAKILTMWVAHSSPATVEINWGGDAPDSYSLSPPFATEPITVRQDTILKTASANFTLGADFEFYRVEVTQNYTWLDKTYSSKHYTRYCLYVASPSSTALTINSWFATLSSTATLTITNPLSTDITLHLFSPNLLSASATGVVSYSWNATNQTLSMVANSDTSSLITISTTVSETAYNNIPENMEVIITDMDARRYLVAETGYYTFVAKYWDRDGTEDLANMKVAFTDGVTWVNASYDGTNWALDSGSDAANIKAGTTTAISSTILQVSFSIRLTTSILDALNVDVYMYVLDDGGGSDGWDLMQTDYFDIYNLGGMGTLEIISEGGVTLWVDGYTGSKSEWDKTGSTPYLDAVDSSYISTSVQGKEDYTYTFENSTVTPITVFFEIYAKTTGTKGQRIAVNIGIPFTPHFQLTNSFKWHRVDISTYINTVALLNDTDFAIYSYDSPGSTFLVDAARLVVNSDLAGRIVGGDVFELYALPGGSAKATVTFRRLQAVHMLYHIWVSNQRLWDDWENNTVSIEMGMDYYSEPDDAWLTGWSVHIEQYEGWLDANTMRLRWTVTWNYRGSTVWTSYMNSFPLVNQTGDDGYPAETSFILDLWFNKINASSTVGGRLTAEWYAMRNNANPWLRWATGNDWGIDVGNVTQAMFFQDLLDSAGDIISVRQVDFMRVWVNLTQAANDQNVRVELRDYDLFDLTTKPTGVMEGINTPIFIATKTPDMPRGGFLNALWAALNDVWKGINDAFGPVILGFWNTFVDFLDTVFSAFGWDNGFSTILHWIDSLLIWLVDSFTWLISLLTSVFTFLSAILGKLLNTLSTVVTQQVAIIQGIFSMLGGGLGTGINIWEALNLPVWITIGAIFYCVYLVVMWDEHGINTVLNHLNMVFNILAWIGRIFITVIQLFITVITTIIESIPVVE